ncbi:glycoside hydrolase family 88/105 protein [Cellvibrio sp. NN19]|uniref:glycoside hydrolase family 88/105 protein n=1 Tax=Cellvibrio chitinivorans TaxID=3102792 RepID=UPI002B40853F|nr:glycoside hydrolase family 88 protein [Cellvibrio sp. NN19]
MTRIYWTLKKVFTVLLALTCSLMFTSLHAESNKSKIPNPQQTLSTVNKLARAEVARLNKIEMTDAHKWKKINTNWISATFFVGTAKLIEVSDVPEVLKFNLETAERFNYAHQGHGAPVHLINADDQAIGDLYQSIYLRTGLPGVLMPLQQRMDYTLPYLSLTPTSKRLVWWWCDSLFMAPPVYTRMSAITGDSKYIDAMDAQYWRVYDRLFDTNENLFARDERFIERRSANNKKIFWSRGQGWVVAGLARILEAMPENYPSRPKYVKLFQNMMSRIAQLQQPDGLWRASLLDMEAYPEPETSGTAFFTYALAFGINHDLLERDKYLPHALNGWAGLNQYILPSGILGQVQSAGDQPVPTKRETTALYASGAFILAGLEIANLNKPIVKLPLPFPKPPKPDYHASDIPLVPLPAHATPDQIREDKRRNAERDAVKALAYDPLVDK